MPVPFVHCASHDLNLVINNAVEATLDAQNLLQLSKKYVFFGRSLYRWAELALTEENVKKPKLKKLCTTRWTSRIDAVRAMKNRYIDILKVLSKIVLTTEDKKERDKTRSLRQKLENFKFLLLLIIWESILITMNKASIALQQK